MRRLLFKAAVCTALIVPAGALGLFGATAAGANFSCNTFIDYTLISGNLTVPSGAECSISNVTVTGNVVVLPGGGLTMDASTVRGNFTGTTAEYIQVGTGGVSCFACNSVRPSLAERSYVYGNATISGTTDTPYYEAFNAFCNTNVGGSLTLQRNLAPFAVGDDDNCYVNNQIGNSTPTVGANMLVSNNQATVAMADVHVVKSLVCTGNNPPPTDDGGNYAQIAVGQCSTFNNPPG